MIEALYIEVTAAVASFRNPLYGGVQIGLPCPPPATIGGMLAAAAGGWDQVDPATRFAATFTAEGGGTDVETWHPTDERGRRLEAQPRDRQFLAGATLRLWLLSDIDLWYRRMRRPVWPLRLGRSQDLIGHSIHRVQLAPAASAPMGHAIVDSGDKLGNLRLPTAINAARDRTQWNGYWYFPDGSRQPCHDVFTDPEGHTVVLLPPTHPIHAESA